jgi:hypothetical protein
MEVARKLGFLAAGACEIRASSATLTSSGSLNCRFKIDFLIRKVRLEVTTTAPVVL